MPTGYPINGINKGWFKKGQRNYFKGKKRRAESIRKMVETRRRNGSYIGWNKGKTAETDSRIKARRGFKWSEETKKKISESRLKGIAEGRIRSWNKGKKGLQISWNRGNPKGLSAWNKGLSSLTDERVRKYIRYGEKHHNWKGGLKTENAKVRSSIRYSVWRKTIFERDSFTCQMPDCDYSVRYLQAHHIKTFHEYPELRFEITNGITLCRNCHEKTKGREKDFEEVFTKIVKEKSHTVLDMGLSLNLVEVSH